MQPLRTGRTVVPVTWIRVSSNAARREGGCALARGRRRAVSGGKHVVTGAARALVGLSGPAPAPYNSRSIALRGVVSRVKIIA